MNRPTLTQILRITWTVAWGTAAVLLVVVWVRSYWRIEHILWNGQTACVGISIYPGEVTLESNGRVLMPLGWSRVVFPTTADDSIFDDGPRMILGFGWQAEDGSKTAFIPFWFLTLTCAAFAWFDILPLTAIKRFSLRTLLIAMTLIAVGLGIVVYLTKGPTMPPIDVGDFQDATEIEMTH